MTEITESDITENDWWEIGIKIYNETRCRNCGYGDGMLNPFGREGRCMECGSISRGSFPRVIVRR